MSAPLPGKFQDHYHVLGIDGNADSEEIHRAYSRLAGMYHPSNKETADQEKFQNVTHAYEVLADPMAKAAFDTVRSGPKAEGPLRFSGAQFFQSLATETARRQCILCILYDRRRQKPATPGLTMRQIESVMSVNYEELMFSAWYLRQRGLVTADDKSNVLITVQGMEHLEQNMPSIETVLGQLKAVDPAKSAPPPAQSGPLLEPVRS